MDEQTVRKIARLSRLQISDDDVKMRVGDIGGIIKWVEQLAEVDTDGVAPLANVANIKLKTREDVITDGGDSEKVLKNAPESTEGFYVVPKVIDEE